MTAPAPRLALATAAAVLIAAAAVGCADQPPLLTTSGLSSPGAPTAAAPVRPGCGCVGDRASGHRRPRCTSLDPGSLDPGSLDPAELGRRPAPGRDPDQPGPGCRRRRGAHRRLQRRHRHRHQPPGRAAPRPAMVRRRLRRRPPCSERRSRRARRGLERRGVFPVSAEPRVPIGLIPTRTASTTTAATLRTGTSAPSFRQPATISPRPGITVPSTVNSRTKPNPRTWPAPAAPSGPATAPGPSPWC